MFFLNIQPHIRKEPSIFKTCTDSDFPAYLFLRTILGTAGLSVHGLSVHGLFRLLLCLPYLGLQCLELSHISRGARGQKGKLETDCSTKAFEVPVSSKESGGY